MCYSMPVCKKGKCEYEIRPSINQTLVGTMNSYEKDPGSGMRGGRCLLVGLMGRLDRLGSVDGRGLVAYCDKECQAAQ